MPGHDAAEYEVITMIPGERFIKDGEIELNAGRKTVTLTVANTGDRPIQVGSHYHFFETNPALKFERKKARGMRLDIPAGTAVRFEPGQSREVTLIAGSHRGSSGLGDPRVWRSQPRVIWETGYAAPDETQSKLRFPQGRWIR